MGFFKGQEKNIAAGIGVASDLYSASQYGNQIEERGEITNYNRNLIDIETRQAIERSALEETRFRRGASRFIGSNKLAIASQGGDISSGSSLDVLAEQAGDAELDAQIIRSEGRAKAFQVRSKGRVLDIKTGQLDLQSRLKQIEKTGSALKGLTKFDFRRRKKVQNYDELTGLPTGELS